MSPIWDDDIAAVVAILILSLGIALVSVACYIAIERVRSSRLWCAVRGHRLRRTTWAYSRECQCGDRAVSWTTIGRTLVPDEWYEPMTISGIRYRDFVMNRHREPHRG